MVNGNDNNNNKNNNNLPGKMMVDVINWINRLTSYKFIALYLAKTFEAYLFWLFCIFPRPNHVVLLPHPNQTATI